MVVWWGVVAQVLVWGISTVLVCIVAVAVGGHSCPLARQQPLTCVCASGDRVSGVERRSSGDCVSVGVVLCFLHVAGAVSAVVLTRCSIGRYGPVRFGPLRFASTTRRQLS